MRGLADQRDAVLREAARAGSPTADRSGVPGSTDTRPSIDCMRSSTRRDSAASSSRASSRGRFGLHDPDQARAIAGQRHLRERPGLGVEFGRGEGVVAAVREIQHQRRLRIGCASIPDACRLARRRQAPVGRDGQRGRDCRSAVGERRLRPGPARGARRSTISARQSIARLRGDGRVRAPHSARIGNVEPEGVLADLAGAERHDRAADQPRRGVDDAHDLQRRGLVREARPARRAVEKSAAQGSSAPSCGRRRRRLRADEHDFEARPGQAERRDQPGRPGAGDEDPLRSSRVQLRSGLAAIDLSFI